MTLTYACFYSSAGVNPQTNKDVFVTDFAPHSELFPRAAAIIHHGEIGSTGRALMSGKPQLITPFNGDQFDNARRVRQLGISETLPIKKYKASKAEALLRPLLDNSDVQSRTSQISKKLKNDTGAKRAAHLIAQCLKEKY